MITNIHSFIQSRLGYLVDKMSSDEIASLESAFKEYSETVIDECAMAANAVESGYMSEDVYLSSCSVDKNSIIEVKEQL